MNFRMKQSYIEPILIDLWKQNLLKKRNIMIFRMTFLMIGKTKLQLMEDMLVRGHKM